MVQPVYFIPFGMSLGLVVLVVWILYERITKKKQNRQKHLLLYLIAVYVTVLLMMTLFSREPGSRQGVELRLFATVGTSVEGWAYFVENIMLFIPYGLLFPLASSWFQKGWNCILGGLFSSIALETIQLRTEMGFCQLDDVVTNTAGAAAGWILYSITVYFLNQKQTKKERCD